VFYTGSAFPQWQGSLLIGSMRPGGLVRLAFDESGRVTREERYREGELRARIRDVVQAADGSLYVLTDSDEGQILRLAPR
jgi:glucose/arabinose dehydrogenase